MVGISMTWNYRACKGACLPVNIRGRLWNASRLPKNIVQVATFIEAQRSRLQPSTIVLKREAKNLNWIEDIVFTNGKQKMLLVVRIVCSPHPLILMIIGNEGMAILSPTV